ncbi:adhesion G protein-coupled receptor L3-like [Dysidea avara]|uniref:adhesion G protein-coupled receptor L3-like n=1 Tax=Dysidea avara TaxID=196820 RepID=UPI003329A398
MPLSTSTVSYFGIPSSTNTVPSSGHGKPSSGKPSSGMSGMPSSTSTVPSSGHGKPSSTSTVPSSGMPLSTSTVPSSGHGKPSSGMPSSNMSLSSGMPLSTSTVSYFGIPSSTNTVPSSGHGKPSSGKPSSGMSGMPSPTSTVPSSSMPSSTSIVSSSGMPLSTSTVPSSDHGNPSYGNLSSGMSLSPSSSSTVSSSSMSPSPSASSTSRKVSTDITSAGLLTNTVLFSTSITPTSTPEYCLEEVTNYTTRPAQLLNATRILYCIKDKVFVTQMCEKFDDDGEAKWYPDFNSSCNDDGLPVSEDLYIVVTTIQNETELDAIRNYTDKPGIEVLGGDPVVIVDVLNNNSRILCTKEYIENFIIVIDNLMDPQFLNVIKTQLREHAQEYFISTLFVSTDDFILNCYNPKYPPPPISNTGLSAVDIEDPGNVDKLDLSTGSYGSFKPPQRMIAMAQETGIKKFRVASYSFENLEQLLVKPIHNNHTVNTFNNFQLISPVNSKVVNCATKMCKEAMHEGVEIVINHHKLTTGSTMCVFYNFSITEEYEPFWSTDGCTVKRSSPEQTVCTCTHLTHFAILADIRQFITQANTGVDRCSQPIAVYACIAFLLLSLVLVIGFLVVYRSLWSLASFVHINLCATLFIAHLLLVLICIISDKAGCATVAILLHYFFLTSFMWMLMEGLVLYIILVKVYAKVNWKLYTGFTLLCYGGPFMYMIFCIPLGLGKEDEWSYGNDEICWLTYGDGFILTFIAPVLLIVIVTILHVMYLFVMRKKFEQNYKIDINSLQTISYCFKRWLQGVIVLTFTMTTTWAVALIYYYKQSVPMAYVFGITLVIEGIIIFLLLTIYFRKMYILWSNLISKKQSYEDKDVPEDFAIENGDNISEWSEEMQTISYSPTSDKDFQFEASESFQEKCYTLKEGFIYSHYEVDIDLITKPATSSKH